MSSLAKVLVAVPGMVDVGEEGEAHDNVEKDKDEKTRQEAEHMRGVPRIDCQL